MQFRQSNIIKDLIKNLGEWLFIVTFYLKSRCSKKCLSLPQLQFEMNFSVRYFV